MAGQIDEAEKTLEFVFHKMGQFEKELYPIGYTQAAMIKKCPFLPALLPDTPLSNPNPTVSRLQKKRS